MSIDLHGMALVAVVAAVTMLIRFLPFLVFGGGRPTPRFITYLAGVLPCAIMAMLVVYCLRGRGLTRPHPRPAGTDRRRRGGGFALLEKEYLIKYCRRDGTVYGAGAGGVCVSVL